MVVPVLVTIVGLLLVGLTFFDVFVTVLHPQAESPFSSRLQTFTWRTLRLASRPLKGRSRHRVLALAVPLLIVVLVATWVTLMVVAFGLIYAAWISIPGAFNIPGQSGEPGLVDALYFSGVTLGTIGYGDFQPLHGLLRLTAVVEGFTGVAVLSMSIAYILEVYPVLQRKTVLAVLLNEETAGQVHGLALLVRYLRGGNFEALAGLLRFVNLELLFLAEAHRRLPVLHYGHPVDVEHSFLRVLLVVQNLVAALRYGMRGGVGR
ncbi:MAG: potassium channel family protein, partial [Chloroflexia bacterium]